ncbi:MAG: hypothetical protein HYV19_11395 [Gemmatimonadetes bacterium]|nr:hypothetical protein [Gemmatimonadota bacterium]
MTFRAGAVLAAPLAAMLTLATPIGAQVTLSGDASLRSEYQARGLTTTNRPVVQSTARLSSILRGVELAASLWASVEGGRYSNPAYHISENGGAGVRVAEWNFVGEATVPLGRVRVTPGVLSYVFPNRTGTTSESNTVELFVTAEVNTPLSPTLSLWRDIHAVRGTYGELGVTHDVGPLSFAAIAGLNWSQSVGDGGALGYYERRGLTHTEWSVATAWQVGTLNVSPSAHLVYGRDPTTRLIRPTQRAGSKLWIGTTVAWERELGKARGNP